MLAVCSAADAVVLGEFCPRCEGDPRAHPGAMRMCNPKGLSIRSTQLQTCSMRASAAHSLAGV
eukprot:m.106134 g.106134  ORF g.106134 m.106134 type:complete len:63 (-) comp9168_c0_seq1:1507-1695(-)